MNNGDTQKDLAKAKEQAKRMALADSCGNCKYMLEVGLDAYCRRYPPTVFLVGNEGQIRSQYPPTQNHMWCGEFVQRLIVQ